MSTSCGWELRQRQVWLIPIADERVGVQVKLLNPLRTRAVLGRFCGGDSLRRGAISSVCTFTFYLLGPQRSSPYGHDVGHRVIVAPSTRSCNQRLTLTMTVRLSKARRKEVWDGRGQIHRGLWDGSPPAGSRGGAPLGGLGYEVSQKLKNFKGSHKQILRIFQ